MAIKKRVKRRIQSKPKPKLSPKQRKLKRHRDYCDELYNRLQRDDDDSTMSVAREIAEAIDLTFIDPTLFTERLCSRFTTKITTLQANSGPVPKFEVWITWTDYYAKPLYGYCYPAWTGIGTGHRMFIAVLYAYIRLSKSAGVFPA